MTICDALEKSLKKGRGEEQAQAAVDVVLVLIQLGVGGDTDELYRDLRPILTTVMADNSMPLKARSAVCILSHMIMSPPPFGQRGTLDLLWLPVIQMCVCPSVRVCARLC